MAYSYDQGNVVNLKHLKKVTERTAEEMSTLAGATAGAIEEAIEVTTSAVNEVNDRIDNFDLGCLTIANGRICVVYDDGK